MSRFMDLSPLSYEECLDLSFKAIEFFSPMNYDKNLQVLGRKRSEDNTIRPLSAIDFYNYLKKIDNKYEKKMHKISKILYLLSSNNVLIEEGASGHDVYLPKSYYFLKELSSCQGKNILWLGQAFGIGYLQYFLEPNVIHITGKNQDGDVRNGTGFLIAPNVVLTCKHVTEDMQLDASLHFLGQEYTYTVKKHEKADVALLILNKEITKYLSFPVFNHGEILEEVLIMGYPPIPVSDNAYLLSQKGEINTVITDYLNKVKNIVVSCTTRPGNSGGPVISRNGYLVGMVTEYTEEQESSNGNTKGKDFPFFMAIDGKELYNKIKEIDENINILFENYD